MRSALALALLLLLSVSFAWPSDFSIPTCLRNNTVAGANFTNYQINGSYSCASDNYYFPSNNISYFTENTSDNTTTLNPSSIGPDANSKNYSFLLTPSFVSNNETYAISGLAATGLSAGSVYFYIITETSTISCSASVPSGSSSVSFSGNYTFKYSDALSVNVSLNCTNGNSSMLIPLYTTVNVSVGWSCSGNGFSGNIVGHVPFSKFNSSVLNSSTCNIINTSANCLGLILNNYTTNITKNTTNMVVYSYTNATNPRGYSIFGIPLYSYPNSTILVDSSLSSSALGAISRVTFSNISTSYGATVNCTNHLSGAGAKTGSCNVSLVQNLDGTYNVSYDGNSFTVQNGAQLYIFQYILSYDGNSNSSVSIPRNSASNYPLLGNSLSKNIYTGYYPSAQSVAYSDFKTGMFNFSSGYQSLIAYTSSTGVTQFIIPYLTYFPGNDVFQNLSNMTTTLTYQYSNQPSYILDSASFCWFVVPPLTVSNLSVPQSQIAYVVSCVNPTSQTPYNLTLPALPLTYSCTEANSTYTLKSEFPVAQTHVVRYGNSTNISTYTQSTNVFNYAVNIDLYPYVNYTVGSTILCQRNNATSIFGLPPIALNTNSNISNASKSLVSYIWFGSIALSYAIPPVLIFSAIMNDYYSFINPAIMVVVAFMIFAISFMANRRQDGTTFKALFAYVTLGITVILYMVGTLNIDPTVFNVLNTFNTNLKAFIDATFSYNWIAAIVLAPTILVEIVGLIVTVPTFIIQIQVNLASTYFPIISGPVALLAFPVILALDMMLILKSYEVLKNLFKPI